MKIIIERKDYLNMPAIHQAYFNGVISEAQKNWGVGWFMAMTGRNNWTLAFLYSMYGETPPEGVVPVPDVLPEPAPVPEPTPVPEPEPEELHLIRPLVKNKRGEIINGIVAAPFYPGDLKALQPVPFGWAFQRLDRKSFRWIYKPGTMVHEVDPETGEWLVSLSLEYDMWTPAEKSARGRWEIQGRLAAYRAEQDAEQ